MSNPSDDFDPGGGGNEQAADSPRDDGLGRQIRVTVYWQDKPIRTDIATIFGSESWDKFSVALTSSTIRRAPPLPPARWLGVALLGEAYGTWEEIQRWTQEAPPGIGLDQLRAVMTDEEAGEEIPDERAAE